MDGEPDPNCSGRRDQRHEVDNLGHEKLHLNSLFALTCRHEGQSCQGSNLVPMWVLHERRGGLQGCLADHLDRFSGLESVANVMIYLPEFREDPPADVDG